MGTRLTVSVISVAGRVIRRGNSTASFGRARCGASVMHARKEATMNRTAKTVRWLARIVSTPIILLWGLFLITGLLGYGEQPSLKTRDYIGLTAMGISLLGLAVAWKWELLGGLTALVAYVVLVVFFDWRLLASPYLLWAIAAILFLSSWWLHRAAQRDTVTKTSGGSM